MRRWIVLSFVLSVVAASSAAELLTSEQIIAVHSFGVSAETIIAKINDPNNTVAPLSSEDLAELRAQGVPEAVIQALLARIAPAASTTVPDHPQLKDVVRMVESGLSNDLVIDQLRRDGVTVRLTSNDLIYLKEHGVSEDIISVLLTNSKTKPQPVTPVTSAVEKTPATEVLPPDGEYTGLVLVKISPLWKDRHGKVVLTPERIYWRDGNNSEKNLEIFPAGLKRVNVKCKGNGESRFCYQAELVMRKGDSFTFQDEQQDMGGNENLLRFVNGLRATYPEAPIKD